MKKLSKLELDVVVNEVIDNLRLIEESKKDDLFENNKNKDLFLSKVNEIKELEDKINSLKKEVEVFEKEFENDGLRVYFISENNSFQYIQKIIPKFKSTYDNYFIEYIYNDLKINTMKAESYELKL